MTLTPRVQYTCTHTHTQKRNVFSSWEATVMVDEGYLHAMGAITSHSNTTYIHGWRGGRGGGFFVNIFSL